MPWFGFPRVRAPKGLPPEVLLTSLVGHTWSHAGIAVQRGDKWLSQAGDAYFHEREMHIAHPDCQPGLRACQKMMKVDRAQWLANQERLRALAPTEGDRVQILCAHDAAEFARWSAVGRSSQPGANSPEVYART